MCSLIEALLYVSVFCRGDWTDVGELGGEWAGESEGWTGELVYLVNVKGFLVLVLVLDGLNVSRKELALP